jgi:hypothetical protein
LGAGLAVILQGAELIPVWLGHAAPVPGAGQAETLLGVRRLLSRVTAAPVDATVLGLGALLLYLILRLITRRDWIAALMIVAILTVNQVGQMGEALWFSVPLSLLIYGTYVTLLLRVGVLAAIAGPFTANLLLGPPHTWALGSWMGSATAVVVPLLLVLALFAFRTALGGHTGLRRPSPRRPDPSSRG